MIKLQQLIEENPDFIQKVIMKSISAEFEILKILRLFININASSSTNNIFLKIIMVIVNDEQNRSILESL